MTKTNWQAGHRAEMLAAFYLRLKGYRILEQRYKTPVGEIDIIAKRGKSLVFVEVKARPDHDQAAHAISQHQQSRITKAAQLFLQRNDIFNAQQMRFDAILISPKRWPAHIKNAWS